MRIRDSRDELAAKRLCVLYPYQMFPKPMAEPMEASTNDDDDDQRLRSDVGSTRAIEVHAT